MRAKFLAEQDMKRTTEVRIRCGDIADIPYLQKLWLELFAHQAAMGYVFPVNTIMAQLWASSLEKPLNRFVFLWVAESAGVISAFLTMMMKRTPQYMGNRDIAYIGELFVDSALRGQGIGTKLVSAARQKARELGVSSIEVQTMYLNEPARKFWIDQGFSPEIVQYRDSFLGE